MSLDAKFLAELTDRPLLHHYDWATPSATYGHFIDLKKFINLEKASFHHLSFARRPTGGGIVFHIWDLAFSFLMPATHPLCSLNTLENYQFVNQIVLEAVQEYLSLSPTLIPSHAPSHGPTCSNFCMARPTIYDVVHNEMKIAGAAQRRTKQGYLHQGTISLAFPHLGLLKDILLSQEEITRAMTTFTFAPLGRLWTPQTLHKARIDLRRLLTQKFAAKFRHH
jgi:lipoate-protein ligase A